jgi:hypothetical protein
MVIQVHKQKSNICSGITTSEPFVELDAVENKSGAILQADVLEMDVSVTFTDKAGGVALLEYLTVVMGK